MQTGFNRRALLGMGGASLLALTAGGVLAQEIVWSVWGGSPYASSEREAYTDAKIQFAMRELGVPEEIRGDFMAAIRANPQGQRGYLDPSDRLEAMMSGPDSRNRNFHALRNVQVGSIAVTRGVVRAAVIRWWELPHNGRVIRLVLPEVCWNWSIMMLGVVEQEWCPEIHIPTLPGDRVMFEISGPRPLPASLCLAIKHSGQTQWSAIPSECPAQTAEGSGYGNCDFHAVRANAMRVVPELQLERQHGGGFRAGGGVTILRLPRQVLERDIFVVSFCILRGDQQSDSVTVEWHNYLGQMPPIATIYESPEQIPASLANHGPRPYDLAIQFGRFGR